MAKRPSAVAIVIAAYAALVFAVLGIVPLWLDELLQATSGRESLAALLRSVELNPGTSPLPYLVQRAMILVMGNSPYVARIPAALCSIAGAAVFARICRRFGIASPAWATALFLVIPLQFRYALEARGYSQGLLCVLLSLLLFLRGCELGTGAAAVLYGLSVGVGLYSQPLTALPVVASLFWLIGQREIAVGTRRTMAGTAGLALAAYLPWFLLQRHAQESAGTLAAYFFSWRQVTPWEMLHEVSGGGYICGAASLAAAAVGVTKMPHRRFLGCVAVGCVAGPIFVDTLDDYFFAARQLLFAVPVLALCAAAGVERLRQGRRPYPGYALAALLIGTAAVSDYRVATVPKDGFGQQAAVLAARFPPDGCLAVVPPNQVVYYEFLRPELAGKICGGTLTDGNVVAVMSPYSTVGEREELLELLNRSYEEQAVWQAGAGAIVDYRRR